MAGRSSCSAPSRSNLTTPLRLSQRASWSRSTSPIRKPYGVCSREAGALRDADSWRCRLGSEALLQRDDRNFGRTVDADRDIDRPDSAAHENGCVLASAETGQQGKPSSSQCTNARQHDLTAVRV